MSSYEKHPLIDNVVNSSGEELYKDFKDDSETLEDMYYGFKRNIL